MTAARPAAADPAAAVPAAVHPPVAAVLRRARRGTRLAVASLVGLVALAAVVLGVFVGPSAMPLALVAPLLGGRFTYPLVLSCARSWRLARVLRRTRWRPASVQIATGGYRRSAVLVDGEQHWEGLSTLWSGSAHAAGFEVRERWNLTPEPAAGFVATPVGTLSAVTDRDGALVLLLAAPRNDRRRRALAERWRTMQQKDVDARKPLW